MINVALSLNYQETCAYRCIYTKSEYLPHRISFPDFSIDNVPKGREVVNLEITTNFNDKIYNKDKTASENYR